MAADGKNDPGVMGNLPRSRPGRRSAKRDGSAARAARTTSSSSATRASGAKATAASGAKPAAARAGKPAPKSASAGARKAAGPRTPPPRTGPAAGERTRSGDPLSQAVKLGTKVAETGVKTGVGILKRLTGR